MQPNLTRQENDPHDALEIAPDGGAAARKDPPMLAPEVVSRPSDPPVNAPSASAPRVDTTFRSTATGNADAQGSRGSMRTLPFRALLLVAVGTAVAAPAWHSYGDAAMKVVANWRPRLASWIPAVNAGPAEQPGATAPSTATADQAAASSAPSAAAPQSAAPAADTPSPESTQLLQSMAHDLAALTQQVGELKATIEQLRAGQQQMSREIAKVSEAKPSEPNLKPRTATLPAPRKPKPPPAYYSSYPPAQTAAIPPPRTAVAPVAPRVAPPLPPPPEEPPQSAAQPDGELVVVRPPMPVR